ncbi:MULTISPECIES: hypothetical protein [Pseudomonas aeruginosa group]|jgi:hypothetical protein|uniref:hypothetical protein n=1 Tax=Pseudomonas aeruginosa group TaxID=136841 RepID=UPI001296B37B|nr:hypothetical protein [Pseudomonas aeruginosa]EIU2680082.1 hypothetical protein [Pseudomonas aeruginosa]EIY2510958.1 hypothetical protein [Pseudomonas aeruginosa]EIY2818829.1 hypothetical protein [Pseudomonas aeruginosa]EKJ7646803.1 hypothetical protein [Pseudomonas aeruginosa]EKU2955906.1 hypothetical protein [Pseudomonas aeruginosa]
MPDCERVLRDLELDLAETVEQRAFVRGRHAGEDRARWQVLICIAVGVILYAGWRILSS